MKTLLLLLLLLTLASHPQNSVSEESSPLTVVSFKWNKSRQAVNKPQPATASATAPAPAVKREDLNVERTRRLSETPGARDHRTESVDARSAAMEKIVQESRSPGGRKNVDGFEHRVKVKNTSAKVVEVVFWEYQFTELADSTNVVRRQFICGLKIDPQKEKELQAFSVSSPSAVISVESLANKSGKHFDEKVLINRVEYADGSIWKRKEWNFAEVKSAITRAVSTPWGAEMCRSL